jgi:RimJ/RimL family protein N-acetyltransferase
MAHTFQSSRLVYRAIEDNDEDKNFIHSLRLDTQAMANFFDHLLKPIDKKSSDAWTEHVRISDFLSVLVCLPKTSETTDCEGGSSAAVELEPIGFVDLNEVKESQRHNRTTDIGILIASKYRRKGYGSEAIEWVLGWAFNHAGLHRVGINCWSHNVGAWKLYERLGFVLEGRKREAIWHDGGWHDIISLGMLENEWQVRKKDNRGVKMIGGDFVIAT